MEEGIRDKRQLTHEDILGLNFVRHPGIYAYRRHYGVGLRSHIMKVLKPEDVTDRAFLDPQRIKGVKAAERGFYSSMEIAEPFCKLSHPVPMLSQVL